MKDETKTAKSTIMFNLIGLATILTACVFIVLSFSKLMIALNTGYLDDEVLIHTLVFMMIGIICLPISLLSFTAEIYKSLSHLEKEVYGKRKNR